VIENIIQAAIVGQPIKERSDCFFCFHRFLFLAASITLLPLTTPPGRRDNDLGMSHGAYSAPSAPCPCYAVFLGLRFACLLATRARTRSASLTARESGKTSATSGSRRTMFVPFIYSHRRIPCSPRRMILCAWQDSRRPSWHSTQNAPLSLAWQSSV